MGGEEVARGVVIKLAPVVGLQRENGEMKLGSNKHGKLFESRESVKFVPQGESPRKMAIIIKNNQVVLKTGSAR